VVLVALAGAVLVAALAGLGPDALVAFGLLLAFSVDIDEEESGRAVVATPRNIALAAVMVAVFAWFSVERLALADLGLLLVGAALIAMPLALHDAVVGPERRHAVWVTRRSLVLAVSGAVMFVYLYFAYGENFNMLVATCLVLPLVLAVSRAWRGRRGELELGLLRHPLRAEVRVHLVQLVNIWVYCALLAGVLAAGGTHFARTWFSLDDGQMGLVLAVFGLGLLLLAALALVPRRRVYLATNLLVAAFSAFLAVQLVHVSVPATEPVALGPPLTGEWLVLNGGHSSLLNGHSPNESNALDFVRLGANGRTHTGGAQAALSDYAGFGMPVLAPAAGQIVEVTDAYPDNPPVNNGDHANHLTIDIGGGLYVSMAHLKQGSVTVAVGDVVRRGQVVAAVGNNGHSNEPHLHLQVQDSPTAADAPGTDPFVFDDASIDRGGPWPWGDSQEPRTGDLVRWPTS
jgi:murein DD-endopeptidase MepM/ murein hydrolase activator NlpD